jgi:hypothetical protein
LPKAIPSFLEDCRGLLRYLEFGGEPTKLEKRCQLNRSMQHLSNQLIHKMLTLKNRSVWLMWPKLARVRFRLIES